MKWMLLACLILVGPALADPATLQAVNAIRADKGRAGLVWDRQLEAAARAHANDMAARGFFSHTGSNGSDLGDRVRKAGFRACFAAENIAKGQTSLEQVLQGWMASSGHRKNILSKRARALGVVRGDGNIWVMVLGTGC